MVVVWVLRHKKTAREGPAPLTIPNRARAKSALANERRRRRRRRVEIPAHAERQIVRGDVIELEDVARIEAGEIGDHAGSAGAQIHVAISQFERDARADLVSETSMRGPGEVPLRRAPGACKTRDRGTTDIQRSGVKIVHAGVGEIRNGDARCTDAGADVGSNAPPRPEIDVGVSKEQQLRLAGTVVV